MYLNHVFLHIAMKLLVIVEEANLQKWKMKMLSQQVKQPKQQLQPRLPYQKMTWVTKKQHVDLMKVKPVQTVAPQRSKGVTELCVWVQEYSKMRKEQTGPIGASEEQWHCCEARVRLW